MNEAHIINPTENANPNVDIPSDAGANFEAALQTIQANEITAPIPDKKPEAAPAKEVAKAEPADGIPEELITGVKPTEVAPAKDEIEQALDVELNVSPKNAPNVAKLRETAKAVHAENKALKEQLAKKASSSAETAPADLEAVKAAQARIAELEASLERADFASSPRVKGLDERRSNLIEGAKSYLEGTEIKPEVVELAASLKGGKRLAALEDAGLTPSQIAAIMPSLTAADQAAQEKEGLLANHKTEFATWKAQQAQAAERQEALVQQQERKVFEQVGQEVGRTWGVLQKVQGNDAWNAQVDSINKTADDILNARLPFPELAKASFAAAAFPALDKMNGVLRERLAAANAKLAKLTAAQPGNDANIVGAHNADPNLDMSPAAVAARFNQTLGGLQSGG